MPLRAGESYIHDTMDKFSPNDYCHMNSAIKGGNIQSATVLMCDVPLCGDIVVRPAVGTVVVIGGLVAGAIVLGAATVGEGAIDAHV
mmetsp:Transcript_38591/g.39007  ORF Transcript_38591/g.39007 Transcript_38591/m.39007 type:complete len:87 (+) Transcript_38591:92-352(+)